MIKTVSLLYFMPISACIIAFSVSLEVTGPDHLCSSEGTTLLPKDTNADNHVSWVTEPYNSLRPGDFKKYLKTWLGRWFTG